MSGRVFRPDTKGNDKVKAFSQGSPSDPMKALITSAGQAENKPDNRVIKHGEGVRSKLHLPSAEHGHGRVRITATHNKTTERAQQQLASGWVDETRDVEVVASNNEAGGDTQQGIANANAPDFNHILPGKK
ncbi:MAG: hypothetical protein Q9162_006262 [Coniocarpon cinnabarinum]